VNSGRPYRSATTKHTTVRTPKIGDAVGSGKGPPTVVSSPSPDASDRPVQVPHDDGGNAPGAGWRRLRLPVGTIGIAVGCMLAWRQALRTGLSDDVFWHRAAGVWMLDHHRVMTHDIFSYTVTGHSWITPEWGYGVLLAESVRLIGPVAFWLLSAGLASLTVLAVALRCRLLGAGWTWTGLLCLETAVAVTLFLDDRPQMVSYLFLALLLLLLSLARRSRRWLVVVPVLFVVWANMHGSFPLGLAVLALEAVVALVPVRVGRVTVSDPLGRAPALATLVVSALATLVNPFGPAVYSSALGVTFNGTIRRLVAEWQSPDFHDPVVLAVVVLPVVITVGYLAVSREDVPAVELVLAAFLLVSTLDAFRFLPYFAIAWCALAARCSPLRREEIRPTLIVWPLLVVLGVSLLGGPWWPAGRPAASVPVRAVTYLEHHRGRVFATYVWNDYLDWVGIRVFVDGRTELYTSTPVLRQYLAVSDLTTDPDPILRSYDVAYVLWPTHSALSLYLEHDPHWRVSWRSATAVVLEYVGSHGPNAPPAQHAEAS
jgi:hypothetical protein